MADWTDIPDSAVDPDAPVTSELAYAWRDNVVAMSEGTLGAPRLMPKALASNWITSFRASSSGVAVTVIDAGHLLRVRIVGDGAFTSASAYARISFSSNNGASWGANQDLITRTANGSGGFAMEIDLDSGGVVGHVWADAVLVGSLSVPSGVNAFRLILSSGSILAGLITAEGGRADV